MARQIDYGCQVIAGLLRAGCALSLIHISATAHADTYSLPRVNIQAQVMENGDLNVTEERTFAFEDTVNGVYWSIPFAQNEQGQTSSVTVSSVYEYCLLYTAPSPRD